MTIRTYTSLNGIPALLPASLLIYPTDTLYALGCSAFDVAALTRLRAAKGREETKALPVIASDFDQVLRLTPSTTPHLARLAKRFWPGPLTLVVPAAPGLPTELIAGELGIAVRIPASDIARSLAAKFGPLVSTSANRSGEPPCETVGAAIKVLGQRLDAQLDWAFDAGPHTGAPSTIVNLMGEPRLLRAGRIDWEEIERAL